MIIDIPYYIGLGFVFASIVLFIYRTRKYFYALKAMYEKSISERPPKPVYRNPIPPRPRKRVEEEFDTRYKDGIYYISRRKK